MSFALLVSVALRGSVMLLFTLLVLFALGRASAALRRLVVLLGLAACLVLPLVAMAFPERPSLRVVPTAVAARIYAETLSMGSALPASTAVAQGSPASPALTLSVPLLALAVWLIGVLFLLARLALGIVRAQRLARRAVLDRDGIRISQDVAGPVVVGLLAPVVLLPACASEWSEERRQAVLMHELAHVGRRDGLALLVAQMAVAVYWFQPLVWIAERRLRRECELAADEDVIASGMRPSRYAEHLLGIARSMSIPAGGIAMAARPSALGRRIELLVSRERLPSPLTRRDALLVCFGAALLLMAAACTEAEARTYPSGSRTSASGGERRLQAIAEDSARRVRAELTSSRVAIVMLDPKTGALLAMSDDAPGKSIVPASTLKPLVVALALDAGLITPDQRFDCGNGERGYGRETLRDAGRYGSLDVREILAVSSNIGISRIFDVLGGERLANGLARFQVAWPEAPANGSLEGAVLAIGQRLITTTPLALARAYAVFANGGVHVAPGSPPRRLIKETTAAGMLSLLENAVSGERATGKAARIAGVRVAGKTGTSDADEIFASFVGIVPADAPRYVIYVGVSVPQREGSGGTIAAPLFARIAKRALAL